MRIIRRCQALVFMLQWVMSLFKQNDNVYESGTHGGPECQIIINKAELTIGRSTVNKWCGACTIKNTMVQARLQGNYTSGLYMGKDGQPRLKECKVSALAFDRSR